MRSTVFLTIEKRRSAAVFAPQTGKNPELFSGPDARAYRAMRYQSGDQANVSQNSRHGGRELLERVFAILLQWWEGRREKEPLPAMDPTEKMLVHAVLKYWREYRAALHDAHIEETFVTPTQRHQAGKVAHADAHFEAFVDSLCFSCFALLGCERSGRIYSRNYVHKACKNKHRREVPKYVEKQKRRRDSESVYAYSNPPEYDRRDEADVDDKLADALAKLNRRNSNAAEVWRMRSSGLSRKAVAERLGISPSAVRKRENRAAGTIGEPLADYRRANLKPTAYLQASPAANSITNGEETHFVRA